MYQLFINDKLAGFFDNLKQLKSIGFVLAVRGHKVAYMEVSNEA